MVKNILKYKTLLWVRSNLILKKKNKVFILLLYIFVKWNTETQKKKNVHKLLICYKI